LTRSSIITPAGVLRVLGMSAALALWSWASRRLGCVAVALCMVPVWASLTLAGAEAAFLRRRLFLDQYLAAGVRLARLLRPGPLLLLRQTVQGLALTVLLLALLPTLEGLQLWLPVLAAVLLILLTASLARFPGGQLRAEVRSPLVRRWAQRLTALSLWAALALAMAYLPQPDYRGLTWRQVAEVAAATHAACDLVALAARVQGVAEASLWWAAQNLFSLLDRPGELLLAWALFLALFGASFLFAWACSAVLAGVLARPWRLRETTP
jgi:hypothetical protein